MERNLLEKEIEALNRFNINKNLKYLIANSSNKFKNDEVLPLRTGKIKEISYLREDDKTTMKKLQGNKIFFISGDTIEIIKMNCEWALVKGLVFYKKNGQSFPVLINDMYSTQEGWIKSQWVKPDKLQINDSQNDNKNTSPTVEYHIYEDHRIECKIPISFLKTPLVNPWPDKGTIKYFYYTNNTPNLVAHIPFHTVPARKTGIVSNKLKIKNYENCENYDSDWIEVDKIEARTKYYFANGDIVVKGIHPYNKIVRYSIDGENIARLVKMPDEMKTIIGSKKIFYTFHKTQRRYCNPDCFAGFIGALAQMSFEDVKCSGLCYDDATCYPSQTHNNGISADTLYLSDLSKGGREQIKINAFRDFFFENILKGDDYRFKHLEDSIENSNHNDHLHAGKFNYSKINTLYIMSKGDLNLMAFNKG